MSENRSGNRSGIRSGPSGAIVPERKSLQSLESLKSLLVRAIGAKSDSREAFHPAQVQVVGGGGGIQLLHSLAATERCEGVRVPETIKRRPFRPAGRLREGRESAMPCITKNGPIKSDF